MDGRDFIVIAGMIAASVCQVHAQSGATASGCRFEAAGTGLVREVVDGRTMALADGREVRLDAIEVPHLPAAGETAPDLALGLAARVALQSMLAGQTIELHRRGAAALDRYGRLPAFVRVARDGSRESAAHDMLARGFARVAAHVGDRACAVELLARERTARDAKLGLWGEPYYSIIGADSGAALLAGRGRFVVAEGKILSVRDSGGTIYMNFGRRWSEALTVTISKRQERIFAAAGFAPKGLENRHVRVRGWVEERNGPRIEALNPEQIELVERN
jgi:endonuclease YncB( thermonuclease family)